MLIVIPVGRYVYNIADNKHTFADPVFDKIDNFIYKICGIDKSDMSWKRYVIALILTNAAMIFVGYFLLRVQWLPIFNPNNVGAMEATLSFNTIVSFMTNTNLQHYSGESGLSYWSQMMVIIMMMFTSAATGYAACMAFIRGLVGKKTMGNFYVDLTRITTRALIPFAVIVALFLVSQGSPQNLSPNLTVTTIENTKQDIAMGPIASLVSIKHLGTNGGGFFNANAAHPFENPTPLSNFLQMLAIFAIPSALTYYFGRAVKNQRHGWAIWLAMAVMFLAGVCASWHAESLGNPIHQQLGIAASDGNMEGKETRFGIFDSVLFATVTTDASCGAVNAAHDSFTPLGGLVPLFNMQTGEVIFGGVGAGFYGMMLFVILAVFIAGLMVGRTPEYLGKKIEAREVKLVMLVLMALAATLLGFAAWASVSAWGQAGINNPGPHGFSEILYAYSSAVANNGSAFAGLTATPANGDAHYNITLALAMLIGRFLIMLPVLAIAGSLAAKKITPVSAGTFRTDGPSFIVLLVGTVLLVGALTHLPALAVGPVVEHFLMGAGNLF